MKQLHIDEYCEEIESLLIFEAVSISTIIESGARLVELENSEPFFTNSSNGYPCLYVVISGRVIQPLQGVQHSPKNRASDHHYYVPGDVVGIRDFFSATASGVPAQADEISKVLILDAENFFYLTSKNRDFCSSFLNAPFMKFEIIQEGYDASVFRYQSPEQTGAGIDGLLHSSWLQDKLPDLFARASNIDSEITLLALNINIPRGRLNVKMNEVVGAISLVLNTALRPTDISVYYTNHIVVTVLAGADAQAAKVVVKRLLDRIARIVVFADMRYPLPHIEATMATESSLSGLAREDLLKRLIHKVRIGTPY